MWFAVNRVIAAVGFVLLVAAAYAELVLDVRAPRSTRVESHGIGTNTSAVIQDFDAFANGMKAKYGPDAVTTIQSPPLRWVTKVNDKVIHEEPMVGSFGGVLGLFAIGAPGHAASMFPFRLDPQDVPPSHRYSSMMLRNRFKGHLPASYLAFDDANVAEGPCVVLAANDLGVVGKLLRIRSGTFCIVDWSGTSRAAALIGAVLADGDPWMRPFTRRICRSLTSLALRRIAAQRPNPPDYAACLLIDRPTREGAPENLRAHVYEVGADGALAIIAPPQPQPVSVGGGTTAAAR
jgi:hypothetical protein